MDPRTIASVLSEIAETASETLELQQVFGRVANSIRAVIPLDNLGVVRIINGDSAVLHAATVPCDEHDPTCTDPTPLSAWSPRLRPRPEPIPRIDDAARELDPSYRIDAGILGAGVRSALWAPFHSDGVFTGGVWASSFRPNAFDDEHQAVLRPIAALLGSAVEHWRIWDQQRRRHERLDRLESLLATLAESLDVRQVFQRISRTVQPVLPHDLLVLTELETKTATIQVTAYSGSADIPVPSGPIRLSPEELDRREIDFEIAHDIPAEVKPVSAKDRILLASGMRSWLRVPVRLFGEIRGGLGFFHREPGRYGIDDVEVARRLADRLALGLSHHRLAEEARVAAEARERAERLEATVQTLTREMEERLQTRIVGVSRSWKDVISHVGKVASSETTVLVTGESGTGKEVVSRLIHQGSARAGRPFVAINCAALPEQLLESELFGHEKGAFTGALSAKAGRLEQAAGGTLFLDEIGEMSPLVQAKLLRVLQEKEFQRLGGARTLKADVRVIAATNRDLEAAISRGQFREDLYYRLNVFRIPLPPLRERREDILPMAESFLQDLGRTMGRPAAGISRDAREFLMGHAWPGNARELRNAIERAILLCDGGLITREHLPAAPGRPAPAGGAAAQAGNGSPDPAAPLPPGGVDLESVDRQFVERALREAKGNKSKAARLLGLTRAQLYSRIEKYGLG
ncbi:MAG TPA: sigma 54-interacting transcriptional regulator [Candidatus Polarisedimenticolia bacterium]|nr:sigma 54-interacting transcriptional regulator [Candidatus Polarisedimenticolia bacterium]